MTEGSDYRQALGRFPVGVTVVTVAHAGERFAMTASALTSVSLDPILLLVCFRHTSATGRAVSEARRFGLSVLGDHDRATASALAVHRGAKGDQLSSVELTEGPGGVPLLGSALARCVCSVERVVRAGDHDVVVGAVEWIQGGESEAEPLLYYDERFWTLKPFEEDRAAEPA